MIASALAAQTASDLGGPTDMYGAIGSNGALNADATEITLTDTSELPFRAGGVYNLHADLIPDHSHPEQPAVLRAVLHGVLASASDRG